MVYNQIKTEFPVSHVASYIARAIDVWCSIYIAIASAGSIAIVYKFFYAAVMPFTRVSLAILLLQCAYMKFFTLGLGKLIITVAIAVHALDTEMVGNYPCGAVYCKKIKYKVHHLPQIAKFGMLYICSNVCMAYTLHTSFFAV